MTEQAAGKATATPVDNDRPGAAWDATRGAGERYVGLSEQQTGESGVAGAAGDLADPGQWLRQGHRVGVRGGTSTPVAPDAISRRGGRALTKLGATDSGGVCVPTTTERVPLPGGRDRITIAIWWWRPCWPASCISPMRTRCWHSSSPLSRQRARLSGRQVGRALGDRLAPRPTGILQDRTGQPAGTVRHPVRAQAGLFGVVKATIVGSILANVCWLLGLAAFVVGGLKRPEAALCRRRQPAPSG